MLTIKPSNKKKKFYKIYFNEEFLGSVPEKILPTEIILYKNENDLLIDNLSHYSFFEKMTNFDIEDFIIFIKEWVYKSALNKIVEYLAKREKTVYDCQVYLRRHELPDKVISEVLKEAQERNWLSNERYASLYIDEAILFNRSPLEIKHNLLQKKIDLELIDKKLAEYYTDDTKDNILSNLVTSLIKRYEGVGDDKLFEKIATTLYRKGFHYSEYDDLLRKMIANRND